jgi:hypothetical protein
MQNSQILAGSPDMVRADTIVAHIDTSKAVAHALGGIAKAHGLSIGQVKAMHILNNGAIGGLAETLTNKGHKAASFAQAQKALQSATNGDGTLKTAFAINEIQSVLSLKMSYGKNEGYEPGIRASGELSATRQDWSNLRAFLEKNSKNINKAGKLTPAAKQCETCLLMWHEFENFSTMKMAESRSKRDALDNQAPQKIEA